MNWFKKRDKTQESTFGQSSKENRKRVSFKHIFGGDILIENVFNRHLRLILLIVILTILNITNRYSIVKKISLIEDLKKELQDEKYQERSISTELIRKTRPAAIERSLQERNIELMDPIEPAFEIQIKK